MGGVMEVKISELIDIYDDEISKNVKNKRKLYNFEKFKMLNFHNICTTLANNNYNGGTYNIFMIKDPKYRIVMSENVSDKVINHYITRKILIPKLENRLDIRNVATRENMGTSYAYELVNKYIEKNKKYKKFYILKLDIKKYFYNINHDILKSMIKKHLTTEEYDIICKILDSTNAPYINEKINEIKMKYSNNSEVNNIPLYKKGKGLPLGNLSSQFLAIYYLNEIDHYIVNNLKLKCMVRYMDDYIIFSESREKLVNCYKVIKDKLYKEYDLILNENKCKITTSYEGFCFLGYKYRIIDNKTIVHLYSKSKKRIKSRLKYKYNGDFKYFFCFVSTYLNIFSKDLYKVRCLVFDRYKIVNFKDNRIYNTLRVLYPGVLIGKKKLYSYNHLAWDSDFNLKVFDGESMNKYIIDKILSDNK